jgi:hypothetical protein
VSCLSYLRLTVLAHLNKPWLKATAHSFQESKPEPQALESHAESLAWPGFSWLALAGLSLQAKASTSLTTQPHSVYIGQLYKNLPAFQLFQAAASAKVKK